MTEAELKQYNPIDVILGQILMSDTRKGMQIYQRIQLRWLKNGFQKDVFNSIGSLYKKNRKVDIVTLAQEFRDGGLMQKGMALKISQLTSFTNSLDARIYLDSFFDELVLQDAVDTAFSFRNQFDNLLANDSLSIEKFNEIVAGLKALDFNTKGKETSISETISRIIVEHENAKNGIIKGLEFSFRDWKNKIVLENDDVMLIAARPGMGKTAIAVQIICDMIRSKRRVIFFSLEMSRDKIMRRVLANLLNIDSNRIKFGQCTQSELGMIANLMSSEIWEYLTIHDGSHSISDISMKTANLQKDGDIDLIIIDYIQKILPRNTNKSRYEQVTELSNSVKQNTMSFRIPTLALAQLKRNNDRPQISDLKDSGELEQDASIITFLHRPEYYGEHTTLSGASSVGICEVITAKNREGSLPIIEMGCDLTTSRFYTVNN